MLTSTHRLHTSHLYPADLYPANWANQPTTDAVSTLDADCERVAGVVSLVSFVAGIVVLAAGIVQLASAFINFPF